MTGGRASAGGHKKHAGGVAAAAKSAYDDVFGGPPRYAVPFAARPDDYSEIFGGLASSCSIPVLDLPPALGGLDGAPVDARRSGFDYAEIFSGFDGAEFAVPYQELFAEPKREEISCSNERDQRRTRFGPHVTEVSGFPPKHPNGDSVACPEEDQFLSYSDHSDDGSKQFNMSYNKTSQGNIEDALSRRTHATQLDAVPGFTTVVDGCDFLQNHTSGNSPDMVNGEIADLDQGKKVLPSSSGNSTKSTGSDLKADQKLYATKLSASQNGHAEVKHHSRSSSNHSTLMEDVSSMDSTYLTISEISLQTQPQRVPPPSRPPPMLFNNQGPSTVKTYANSRADLPKVKLRKPISNHQTRYGVASSKSHANQESVKDNSPPFFDVEVDASSAAAAMKKAMELAEARLKIAKELMERKYDNLQSRKKLDHHQAAKCKERKVENAAQEVESFNLVRPQKTVVKEDRKINGIASEERNDVIGATEIALDNEEKERHVVSAEEHQQSIQENDFKSSTVSHNLENDSGKLRMDKEFCELIDEEKKDKMAREASEQNIIMKNAKETTVIREDEGSVDEDAGWIYEFTRTGKLVEDDGNGERLKDITKLKDGNVSCRDGEIKEVPDMIPEACVRKEKKDMLEEDQDPDQEESENLGEVQEAYVNEEEVKKQYTSDKAPACGESEMTPELSDAACKFEGNYASGNEERKLEAAKEACEREDNEKKLSTIDVRWIPCKHEDNLNMDCKTGIQDEIEKEIEVPPGSCMWERGEEMEAAQAASQCEDSEKARIKGKVECHYAGNEHRSEETWAQHEQEASKKVNATEEACLRVKNELKLKAAPEADNLEGDLKIHETEQEKKTGLSKEAFWQECNEMKTIDAQLEFVQNDKRQEGDQAPVQLKNEQAVFESGHWETRSKDIKEVYVAPDIMEGVKKLNGAREVFQRTVNTVIEDVWQASLLAERVKIPCSAQDSLQSSTLASVGTGQDVQESSLLAKRGEVPSSVQDAMKSSDLVSNRTGEDVQQASLLTNKGKILSSAQDAMTSRDLASNRTGEDVQQASLLTNKGKIPSSVQDTMKSSALESDKTASNLCKTEERKNERRIESETVQVKEQNRKLEEEKERKREREKDRLAVERAICEARERAFAEARERAERIAVERVTAEAKQRALTEAREKAEKSALEAQERSIAEKALREARLRAERAAVERATAEARERAVEKALAGKAASEARECKERFVDTSSYKMRKDNIAEDYFKTRVKDVRDVVHGAQFQSTSSSSTSQRNSDFNSQAEGESNLRYKASLERHQRTVERAAKALAEKNMRDLLAQREQAERNRLAEHLDADVKRWSNGKEGNLRALLSTLQYILGPESGWQPIPLTDVITAAAVKKAYRKATLCVHPDKLQQRSASIQQKYICEKVFDLLKEAWNRFNSEER